MNVETLFANNIKVFGMYVKRMCESYMSCTSLSNKIRCVKRYIMVNFRVLLINNMRNHSQKLRLCWHYSVNDLKILKISMRFEVLNELLLCGNIRERKN